jgi:signal transduction histidine kinase
VDCIKGGMTDYVLKDRLFRLPMVLERSLREYDLLRQQQEAMQQIQQQAKREAMINQISRALNSSLDPDYILQEIVRLTGECFKVDRVLIFAITKEHIRITHEWRTNPQVVSMLDFTAPVTEWPHLIDSRTGLYSSESFHVPNYASIAFTPARMEMLYQRQTHSILSVPIFIREQFFGGVDVHTTTALRTFTEDEIHLLQRIADQAAIALYNAHSYERLEQLVWERTRELEEEKLISESANRSKTEFLANISHELRTPLTGILGFSSLLLKQIFGSLTEKQEQYISSIYTCGNHLLELINDLLDLSKIEAGREDLVFEPADIRDICCSCMAFIREQAEAKGLQISLDIASDVETCTADKRRLKQILVNLLSNAVKFTDTGSVRLNVQRVNDQIQFAVTDTGIGIAATDIPSLFQPFRQLDSGFDRKYQGTGLGLALARKLAQLHQGGITVLSHPGQGSCFTLSLPVLQRFTHDRDDQETQEQQSHPPEPLAQRNH